jgi:hypothetical protein
MSAKPRRPDTTPTDLRDLLVDLHRRAGWSTREIAVLLHTHEEHGLLRSNCPLWKQQAAFFILSKSQPIDSAELDVYADRITEAILLRVP